MTPRETSANITPSAKRPAPPNSRRSSTGPKAANNSRVSSGDKPRPRGLLRFARGLELDRFAAAAGGGLVGIVEHELRREPVGLVVHLGADEEKNGIGIGQQEIA